MNSDKIDFEDLLVKKAYQHVKLPPCPNFAAIDAKVASTEKKGFWSNVWGKFVKASDDLSNSIKELSDDALDGVCAAGDKKNSDTEKFDDNKTDKDLFDK